MTESGIDDDLAESAAEPLDTSGMALAHKIFRDAMDQAPELVASAADPERGRVEYVANYYDNILRLLHAHHEAEDVVVWPPLEERAGDEAAEVLRIAAQHDAITPALNSAEVSLASWRAGAGAEGAAAFAAAIDELGAVLIPHFDEEERVIIPLAAQYITASEWERLPAEAMQRFDGDTWLIVGLGLSDVPPEQLPAVEEHMPADFREAWRSIGRPHFDALMADLRAS